MTTPLQAIHGAGQSIWLDSITRGYLGERGYLSQLIEAGDVWGLTSNPAIFAKAVAGDEMYAAQVAEELAGGADARQILWAVMKTDITDACDAFAQVYEDSNGTDGFVSIEVDPAFAFDTDATVSQAKELWAEIDKPNLMVKVPGTEQGLPAITELIASGINVNVTLLFSIERYQAVMQAHMAGLQRRAAAGEDLSHVASVASFFVSRVDVKVDAILPEGHSLRSTIAIANARAAYGAFLAHCGSDAWGEVSEAGAQPQRPLWASTGTKDPSLPDTLYVDELVGPTTVNTVPEATLNAVRDHGAAPRDRLTDHVADAEEKLQALAEAGVDLGQITKELETDGVEQFISSFEDAVSTVAEAQTS